MWGTLLLFQFGVRIWGRRLPKVRTGKVGVGGPGTMLNSCCCTLSVRSTANLGWKTMFFGPSGGTLLRPLHRFRFRPPQFLEATCPAHYWLTCHHSLPRR
ncbi:hypothetical protein EDB80DRAFT_693850 [Ilyonectria destructans]|nr:hypothetical protein EDB80DRAFT_693850 [Ilyonectria destructans]